jgi:hypothetical protein
MTARKADSRGRPSGCPLMAPLENLLGSSFVQSGASSNTKIRNLTPYFSDKVQRQANSSTLTSSYKSWADAWRNTWYFNAKVSCRTMVIPISKLSCTTQAEVHLQIA